MDSFKTVPKCGCLRNFSFALQRQHQKRTSINLKPKKTKDKKGTSIDLKKTKKDTHKIDNFKTIPKYGCPISMSLIPSQNMGSYFNGL